MNNQQKQQVTEQVKAANNVLVAVSSNPTVDELAASVGLTLALNKLGKHATTVFSGVVPSTIEFLQPEKTIETTTDSLRDFIIALDKSKADKLRYKVEDNVVRIFITPYRTSISDKDLEFSQGDFNVDVVLALGVTRQDDLDKAITAHGRILHDATVISITNRDMQNELGAMNWQDVQASSLCEMISSLTVDILPEGMDGQMATALLTGIIAETDRFKNEKTTPLALSLSSQLMSAGANQQLIAEKLDEPEPAPELEQILEESNSPQSSPDGTLEIDHNSDEEVEKIHIDEHGNLGINEDELVSLNEQTAENAEQPQEGPEESTKDQESDSNSDVFFGGGSDDSEEIEKPTLQQPDSTDTPMMEHQRVVQPPVHDGDIPKTDKPFDLQEAMNTEAVGSPVGESPSLPIDVQESADPEPLPEPEPQPESETVPEPAPEPVPLGEPSHEPTEAKEETVETPVPANDSLAELEKAIGSPHAFVNMTSEPANTQTPSEEVKPVQAEPVIPDAVLSELASAPLVSESPVEEVHPNNLEPPKVASPTDNANDPNAAPPLPPPMTPQFFDSDGNNANPFLNPHQ